MLIRVYGLRDMMTRMKTTIELPDSLATQAKEVAREHKLTLRELVTEGLRAELERLSGVREPAEFRFRTQGGVGLRPDVTPGSLTGRAYDLPS